MKVKFSGVRGSIPSPGPRTARYGGNTTCIEVRSDDDTLIVIDGGTGIFALAQSLIARQQLPVYANIFITHSHWDHIHGLPFFTPLFIRGSRVRLHGITDPVTGNGIEHVMGVQLQNSYFPVSETQMDATIEYKTLYIGEPVTVGDATVHNVVMNHPVTEVGHRMVTASSATANRCSSPATTSRTTTSTLASMPSTRPTSATSTSAAAPSTRPCAAST